MAQQPDYTYMNQRIAFIENALENATTLHSRITHDDNTVAFEDYTELRELYYEITEAITDYFDYLHKVGIPQKDSYLFTLLYGKYYRIETIDEIDALLEELDEQVCAEELSTN
jgi:hypothetical protein